MTFVEWCKQITKEMDYKVPYELVRDLLTCAIRVGLEEILTDRDHATLDITGIVKFWLQKRWVDTNITKEPKLVYYLHTSVYQGLKDVYNERKDNRTLLIGGSQPLYPEYMFREDGTRIRGRGKRRTKTKYVKPSYTIKSKDSYMKEWRRAKREALKESMPIDDDDE